MATEDLLQRLIDEVIKTRSLLETLVSCRQDVSPTTPSTEAEIAFVLSKGISPIEYLEQKSRAEKIKEAAERKSTKQNRRKRRTEVNRAH